MTLAEAIDRVIAKSNNEYAIAYAKQAVGMPIGSEALQTQLLYLQSNLSHWRGDEAREVKTKIASVVRKYYI